MPYDEEISIMPTPTPLPETIGLFSPSSGLWIVIASIPTAALAILTFFSLKENTKARKAQLQPNIIVNFVIEDYFTLELIVKNTGNSAAQNVNININPQINHPFNNIGFLAPNSEMRHKIAFLKPDAKIIEDYDITISYLDVFNKKHANNYPVNIKSLLDSYMDNKPDTLQQIANGLNDIAVYLNSPKSNL